MDDTLRRSLGRLITAHNASDGHDNRYYTKKQIDSMLSGVAGDLSSHTHTKADITDFPTSMPASDVYAWAKKSTKPSYSWDEITGKPTTFTPGSHSHAWGEITNKPETYPPAPHSHGESLDPTTPTATNVVFAGPSSGSAASPSFRKLVEADLPSHEHAWTEITNKPATYPASAHSHSISELTDFPTSMPPSLHSHAWGDITDKPATYPPSAHSHGDSVDTSTPVSVGFVFAGPSSGSAASPSFRKLVEADLPSHSHKKADITDFPTSIPPSAHSHTWTEITNKPATYPASAHSHAWGDITDKPATYPPSAHSHGDSVDTSTPVSSNTVFAGPYKQGTSGTPSFRALVPEDLPLHHNLVDDFFSASVNATNITSYWKALSSYVDTSNGYILKSISCESTNAVAADSWLLGYSSAGVAFGGGNTHGAVSIAWHTPLIRFAGGRNNERPWHIDITGTNGESYNLHEMDKYITQLLASRDVSLTDAEVKEILGQ